MYVHTYMYAYPCMYGCIYERSLHVMRMHNVYISCVLETYMRVNAGICFNVCVFGSCLPANVQMQCMYMHECTGEFLGIYVHVYCQCKCICKCLCMLQIQPYVQAHRTVNKQVYVHAYMYVHAKCTIYMHMYVFINIYMHSLRNVYVSRFVSIHA